MIIPPKITEDEVHAMVACADGVANARQAKVALDWVMREASRVLDLSYQENSRDGTIFAEGRRYVGMLIRQMLEPETLARAKSEARKKGNRPIMTDAQAEAIVTRK
jgi:hypothetical protein